MLLAIDIHLREKIRITCSLCTTLVCNLLSLTQAFTPHILTYAASFPTRSLPLSQPPSRSPSSQGSPSSHHSRCGSPSYWTYCLHWHNNTDKQVTLSMASLMNHIIWGCRVHAVSATNRAYIVGSTLAWNLCCAELLVLLIGWCICPSSPTLLPSLLPSPPSSRKAEEGDSVAPLGQCSVSCIW